MEIHFSDMDGWICQGFFDYFAGEVRVPFLRGRRYYSTVVGGGDREPNSVGCFFL